MFWTSRSAAEQAIATMARNADTSRQHADRVSERQQVIVVAEAMEWVGAFSRAAKAWQRALETTDDPLRRPELLVRLGTLQGLLGHSTAATTTLEEALSMTQASGEALTEAAAQVALGELARNTGDIDNAMHHLQAAIEPLRQARQYALLSDALASIAKTYQAQKQYVDAFSAGQEAYALTEQSEGEGRSALRAATLATLQLQVRPDSGADELAQYALTTARRIGHRRAEAKAIAALGGIHLHHKRYPSAQRLYLGAFKLHSSHGLRRDAARDLEAIGVTFLGIGKPRDAIASLERGLVMARDLKDLPLEADLLTYVVQASRQIYGPEKRIPIRERFVQVVSSLDNAPWHAALLCELGNDYRQIDDYRSAIRCYEQSLAISRERGDGDAIGVDLSNLGTAWRGFGDIERARTYYTQALELVQEVDSPAGRFLTAALAALGEE